MKMILGKIFNIIKTISILIVICLYALFCFFITAFLSINILTVGFGLRDGFDWQIIIYIIYLAMIILGSLSIPWFLFFIKTKISKIFIVLIYLILFFSYFYTHSLLPSVKEQYDLGRCADWGGRWDSIEDKCIMPNSKKTRK